MKQSDDFSRLIERVHECLKWRQIRKGPVPIGERFPEDQLDSDLLSFVVETGDVDAIELYVSTFKDLHNVKRLVSSLKKTVETYLDMRSGIFDWGGEGFSEEAIKTQIAAVEEIAYALCKAMDLYVSVYDAYTGPILKNKVSALMSYLDKQVSLGEFGSPERKFIFKQLKQAEGEWERQTVQMPHSTDVDSTQYSNQLKLAGHLTQRLAKELGVSLEIGSGFGY
jgi:hypothetical protein